jgi:thioredoxin-related protein
LEIINELDGKSLLLILSQKKCQATKTMEKDLAEEKAINIMLIETVQKMINELESKTLEVEVKNHEIEGMSLNLVT